MPSKKSSKAGKAVVKAISINQPFADLVVSGVKFIENRPVRSHYRGKLLIHASQKAWPDEAEEHRQHLKFTKDGKYRPVRGAIIGEVVMTDVVTKHKSRWFEGPFGYILTKAKRYKRPIPCDGWLGIWPVTPERLRKKKATKGK